MLDVGINRNINVSINFRGKMNIGNETEQFILFINQKVHKIQEKKLIIKKAQLRNRRTVSYFKIKSAKMKNAEQKLGLS